MELKLLKTGNPYFSESFREVSEMQRKGEIRGMAMVYIGKDDKIYTDWVKNDGTSVCEILGAVNILENQLIEKMKGK